MSRLISLICSLLIIVFFAGCYHAQVTTGEEPSSEIYEETFASGWLFGLVPPDVVRAQDECTHGVARVETRLSFLNMLVGNLTLGIYTPMHIKVTCSASRAGLYHDEANQTIKIEDPSSKEQIHKAFQDAAELALEKRQAVYVELN